MAKIDSSIAKAKQPEAALDTSKAVEPEPPKSISEIEVVEELQELGGDVPNSSSGVVDVLPQLAVAEEGAPDSDVINTEVNLVNTEHPDKQPMTNATHAKQTPHAKQPPAGVPSILPMQHTSTHIEKKVATGHQELRRRASVALEKRATINSVNAGKIAIDAKTYVSAPAKASGVPEAETCGAENRREPAGICVCRSWPENQHGSPTC
jgi:hypothetical protein